MPDLNFQVEKVESVPHAAVPQLVFKLRVSQPLAPDMPAIPAVALRCQVRIEPAQRSYRPEEQERLLELFGEPARWGQTLRSMLWLHTQAMVPPFRETRLVDLPVPCTYDFNLAATKYFYGLENGDIPLAFLFSGTIFYAAEDGALQVAQVPWEKEAVFRLPVKVWQEMMDHYYPNSAWLCLRKDVFDRLYEYKRQRGLPTWEQALESLLPPEGQRGKS
ncbi:MAG: hypothetical protein JO112_09130 [Planctomycetes bacterium]|nr:hypothetical protein [Planctomycetota bacterium]